MNHEKVRAAIAAMPQDTYQDRALALGVSVQTLARWRSGLTTPTYQNVVRLADLSGYEVEELLA